MPTGRIYKQKTGKYHIRYGTKYIGISNTLDEGQKILDEYLKTGVILTKKRGTGYIVKQKNGRYHVRYSNIFIGVADTIEEAKEMLNDYKLHGRKKKEKRLHGEGNINKTPTGYAVAYKDNYLGVAKTKEEGERMISEHKRTGKIFKKSYKDTFKKDLKQIPKLSKDEYKLYQDVIDEVLRTTNFGIKKYY